MVWVRSRCKKKRENQSCWQWRRCHSQSLLEGNENEEGSESEDYNVEHESFPGPFVESEEGGLDEVGRRRMMRKKRDENEGDPAGNIVEGGRDG